MSLINQYSFLWIGLAALALLIFALRRGPRGRTIAIAAGGLAALGLVWLLVRPTQTAGLGEAAQVRARIGAGMPVLLELQSPY